MRMPKELNFIEKVNIDAWDSIYSVLDENEDIEDFYFITNYCIENESSKCRKSILDFLKEHGLNKNLYKKKLIKYIKWKN